MSAKGMAATVIWTQLSAALRADFPDLDLPTSTGPAATKAIHDLAEGVTKSAAVAAIQFALEAEEGLAFLRCWNYGEFDAIRREWPEAPESVYVGADLMHSEVNALSGKHHIITAHHSFDDLRKV